MTLIDNITSQSNQVTQVVLADGSIMTLTLIFTAAIQRWTFHVQHPKLVLSGLNLCLHPNILREWRNLIPFGLACNTITGVDPIDVEAFSSGRAQLYALSAADVQLVEQNVFGGVLQ